MDLKQCTDIKHYKSVYKTNTKARTAIIVKNLTNLDEKFNFYFPSLNKDYD